MRILIRLAVILIVIGVIAMTPYMFNWDSYAVDIQNDFNKETGFVLKVEGGISFKMFPPSLYLKNVRIGDFHKPKEEQVEIVKAEGIRLDVGVIGYFSLFFKKVTPQNISLVKPQFNTKHIKGGEFDVSKYLLKNIVAKEDVPEFDLNSASSSVAAASNGFNFKNLSITDGVIRIESEQLKRSYSLERVNGKIMVDSVSGPFAVKLTFNYQNVPYDLLFKASELSKRIPTNIKFDLTKNGKKKSFLKVSGSVDAKNDFSGNIDGDFASLAADVGGVFTLDDVFRPFSAPTIFNSTVEMNGFFRKIKEIRTSVKSGVSDDNSTNGKIDFVFDEDRKLAVNVEFSNVDATPFLRLAQKLVSDVKSGKNILTNDVRGTVNAKFDVINYKGNVAKKTNFSAELKEDAVIVNSFETLLPGDGRVSINGKFSNSDQGLNFNGKTDFSFDDFDVFAKAIGKTLPVVSSGTYRRVGFSSVLNGSVNSFKADDIVARLDYIDVIGNASYEKRESAPMLNLALSSKTIDIDPYVKRDGVIDGYGDFLTLYIEKIKNLLPFDYDISIDTKKFTYMGNDFSDFVFNVISVGDKILIKKLSTSDVGGMRLSIVGGIGKTDNSLYGFKSEVDVPNVLGSDLSKFLKYLKIKVPNLGKLKSANIISEFNGNVSNLAVSSVIKSDTMTIGLNGNFGDKYRYEIDITHPNFKTFLSLFQDYYYPEEAGVWFKFRANVYNDTDRVVLKDINSSIGSMRFTGYGNISKLDNGRDMLSFNIETPDLFIVDTFLPKGDFVFWHNDNDKKQVAWSKEDINLAGLSGYDAKLVLSADKVEAAPLTFGKTTFTAELENQNLTIKAVSDDFYKGRASVNASIAFSGEPTAKIGFDLENIVSSSPLFNAKVLDLTSGTYTVKTDLTMIGKSVYNMFTNVNGNGSLKITNGALSGASIDALPRYQKAVVTDKEYITSDVMVDKLRSEMYSGKINFSEFNTQLIINNGILRMLDAVLNIPEFTGKVSNMTIDIPKWSVNMTDSFSIADAEPVTLILNGGLDNPSKEWNVNSFVQSLSKISTDNKELADTKARQNMANVSTYLEDSLKYEKEARVYVSELREMASKEKAIVPVYEKALEELGVLDTLNIRRDAIQKIKNSGKASVEDVEVAKRFYDDVHSHYGNIERLRSNTVSAAAQAMIKEYSKNAMTSANAIMSLVANNPDNDKVKEISSAATANAIKIEVLAQKAEATSNTEELKRLQASAVQLAIENINLEASAREEMRKQNKEKQGDEKEDDAFATPAQPAGDENGNGSEAAIKIESVSVSSPQKEKPDANNTDVPTKRSVKDDDSVQVSVPAERIKNIPAVPPSDKKTETVPAKSKVTGTIKRN